MYLQHSIRPHTFHSNKISKVEEDRTSLSILPINNFDNGIRYLQRTLLGFDADNPQISFSNPGFLPWEEQVQSVQMANGDTSPILVVPGFESLYIMAKDICYVNYLPAELLREIFSYLLPGRDWKLEETYPPQLILAQVCSYWRNIAISDSRLWSTFMIVRPVKQHIPMTKLWLERSGQHPLTVYIDHQGLEFEETFAATDAVIDLLRPHVHRWKAVTFILASGIHSSLLALPRDEYPLLETLCFDTTGVYCWSPDAIARVEENFFPSSSPMLREITWETHSLSLNSPPMVPSNITYLSGDFPMDHSFFESLSKLRNLETLRLHGSARHGIVFSPLPTPLVLHRLQSFEFRSDIHTPFLLDSIVTPSLKILVIARPVDEKTQKSLCSFIQRSRCCLSAFSLLNASGDDLENQFLKEFLVSPYMEYLSELNILSSNADAVFMILAEVNSNEPVLPSLNRLWISTWRCSGDLLLDMLECRAHNFRPPTSTLMSESLFCVNHPHRSQYLFIPVSGISLCIQVTLFKSCSEDVSRWFKSNGQAHWSMFTASAYWEPDAEIF
ncbi:hypothetical protein GG344DRAFT_67365 [Lentinula edodes]|nr:hypothetical protein GG344DRAFT_67365 [Lentinula edodes]